MRLKEFFKPDKYKINLTVGLLFLAFIGVFLIIYESSNFYSFNLYLLIIIGLIFLLLWPSFLFQSGDFPNIEGLIHGSFSISNLFFLIINFILVILWVYMVSCILVELAKKERKKHKKNSIAIGVIFIIIIAASGFLVHVIIESESRCPGPPPKVTTHDEIHESLLEDDTKVAIPFNNKALEPGDTGKLPVGIKSTLNYTEFKIETDCLKAYDSEDNELCNDDDSSNACNACDKWVINTQTERVIVVPRREIEVDALFLKVPEDAEPGTYVYNLKVKKQPCSEDCIYGKVKRFYVTVK